MRFHCHVRQFAAGCAPTGGENYLPFVRGTSAQKTSFLTKIQQQNECPNNVQPPVTVQPENGHPQRNHLVNIINYGF
jgi:hypothetical protein